MNRTRDAASLLVILVMVGCAGTERIASPIPVASASRDAALRAAYAGPRVTVAVPAGMRDVGCALVERNAEGLVRATSIPRQNVIHLIGRLDSIQAPVVAGRVTSGSVHIVSADLEPLGDTQRYVVNCLGPWSLTQSAFRSILASSANHPMWSAVIASLRPHSTAAGAPDYVIASDVLLAGIRSGAPPRVFSSGAAMTGSLVSPIEPRFTLECGEGTDWACGAPTLPTVTVTASPGWPVVIDMIYFYRSQRIYSLSEIYAVNFYDGPTCANASETWLALEQTIQELRAKLPAMQAAANAVASQVCQSELTEGGKNLCIDLFIMSETVGLFVGIFRGDGRGFDSSAAYTASRAQLYINPESCTVGSYVNTSRTTGFGPLDDGPMGPHALNRVTATQNRWGECVVEWRLYNGWCEPSWPTIICPPIDGRLVLRSDGNGGWAANLLEDKFPSREVNVWRGTHWESLSKREEGIFLDLWSLNKSIEKLEISRDAAMPLGCQMQ